jgi:hypothetical protein
MMEAIYYSETSFLTGVTRHDIQEDGILLFNGLQNLVIFPWQQI